jgi:hypothetical protein
MVIKRDDDEGISAENMKVCFSPSRMPPILTAWSGFISSTCGAAAFQTPNICAPAAQPWVSCRTLGLVGPHHDASAQALVGIFEALFKRDKKFPLDLSTVSPEDLCEASGEAQLPGPGGDASDEEILEEVTAAAPRRAAPAHATVASKHAQIGLRRQESRRQEALRAEEAHVSAGAAAHQYEEAPGQGPPPQAHVATPTAMPVFAQITAALQL